ncbi:MAG: SDR family NAD(P)-dependent oxidoreductase [Nocardioides sp.]
MTRRDDGAGQGPLVAVVTGGGSGLGLHLTTALLAQGHRVVAGYATSADNLATVAHQVGDDRLRSVRGNLAEEETSEALVAATADWGRLDMVLHNASVTRDSPLVRMDGKDWDAVVDVNLRGAFLLSKHAVRQMMRQRHGRLLYISSIAARLGNAGQANYAASKAGLDGIARSVSQEYARYGVTTTVLAAGLLAIGMGVRLGSKYQEQKASRLLHGAIDPAELARIAVCLASPDFRAINATTVNVDTGMVF